MALSRRTWLKTVASTAAATSLGSLLTGCGHKIDIGDIALLQPAVSWPDEQKIISLLPTQPIPCTRCGRCMPCAYGVNIPDTFDLYNRALTDSLIPLPGSSLADNPHMLERASRFLDENEARIGDRHAAHRCIACCHCLSACPARIPIVGNLNAIGQLITLIRERQCQ